MKAKMAKELLCKAIQDLEQCKWLFVNNPDKDFTRKRKLPFAQIVKLILSMQGGSMANEIIFYPDLINNSPSVNRLKLLLSDCTEDEADVLIPVVLAVLSGLRKKGIPPISVE